MYRVLIQKGTASDTFAAIRDEWQQLFAVAEASPFLSWEWMSTWFDTFGANKLPCLLKAYRGETLIGILPMYREKRRLLGISFNRLSMMGNKTGGADYLDLIARPEDRSGAMTAIFEYLCADNKIDVVCLENLAEVSESVRLLRKPETRSGHRFDRVSESVAAVCPQIDLSAGWESVLSHSKRRDNFKRRLKKIEKLPGFEFRSVTSPEQTGGAFERFLDLHQKRWENDGGSELTGHPRLAAFQRDVVTKLAAKGLIRFDELWLGGECRGSVYGLDNGRAFYYYNSGYDLDFSNLSVGLVLLGLSIQSAVRRGNVLYDFLRGDETYKSEWANRRAVQINFALCRSSITAFAHNTYSRAMTGIRDSAKYALPSGVAATIGNLRRVWKRNYQLSGR